MPVTTKTRVRFRFRLFIAAGTPNSSQALANLNALCLARIAGQYEIEVVDVLEHPDQALAEGIFMTPMLIVLAPSPPRRIAGTLSNPQILADVLGLDKEYP